MLNRISQNMDRLLIIEDDFRLAQMVSEYLHKSGFEVVHASSGLQGLQMLGQSTKAFGLVILDLMLPDIDGLEVCRKIRALSTPINFTPVLMLTAKGDPMDRVVGLELGADDYIGKPFEPRELLARIKAILRRRNPFHEASIEHSSEVLKFGSLEIDKNSRTVSISSNPCDLTSYQFDLLLVLAERAGRVLSRDQIMESVRGRELDAFDRSIDVHIGRIRLNIQRDIKNPNRILTVRGVGYVFAKQQD